MPSTTKTETPPQISKTKSKPSKKAPPPPRPHQPAPAPPVQTRTTSISSSNGGVARPRSLINTAQGQNQRTHVSFYSYTIPDDAPPNQNGNSSTGDSFERTGNSRNQQSGDVLQIDNWEALDTLPQILGLVSKETPLVNRLLRVVIH